ncbi:MAG: Fumarate hydratase class [Firmicutes bacterium]|nr:Fumarate hydratase class [Bacillota bacterium]
MVAKAEYKSKPPIKDIILQNKLLTKEKMDAILSPEEMTQPGIAGKEFIKHEKAM